MQPDSKKHVFRFFNLEPAVAAAVAAAAAAAVAAVAAAAAALGDGGAP